MASFIALYRALAEALYFDQENVITGVAKDHTTTTLTDTIELLYSSGDADTFDGKFVYLEAIGGQSRVTEGGFAGSTGVLTLSPAVTDAPTVVTGDASNVSTTSTTLTDTDESMSVDEWIGYTVYAGGQTLDVTSNTATVITGTGGWSEGGSGPGAVVWTVGTRYVISDHSPRFLRRALNSVLRNKYLASFFPLSIHLMGNNANDMEASTVATDYSSTSATNATESTIVHSGAQSLKVTDSGSGGGYANTGSIGMPESKSLYAAIMCYVTSGDSATFRVIDVTDSNATIEDATTDEPSWMELVYQFSTPSDCEQIDFRLIADSASDVIYWDDFQVWAAGRQVYSLPSWVTEPGQVLDVRGFPQGTGGPAADNDYRVNEQRSYRLPWGFESVDRRGTQELRIWVDAGAARPFIYAMRPLPELTSDSATTVGDQETIINWACRYMEAETARERNEVLALLRATAFARVTMELPKR